MRRPKPNANRYRISDNGFSLPHPLHFVYNVRVMEKHSTVRGLVRALILLAFIVLFIIGGFVFLIPFDPEFTTGIAINALCLLVGGALMACAGGMIVSCVDWRLVPDARAKDGDI